jgi:hypothetical protein
MQDDDPDDQVWRCIAVHRHKVYINKKGKRHVLVEAEWLSGDKTWVQQTAMALHDPYVLLMYAQHAKLLKHPDWKWVINIVTDEPALKDVVKAHNTRINGAPRYKFGVMVPRNVRHALEIDRLNGDHQWQEAMDTELKQINEYETFRLAEPGEDLSDHQCIPYHIVFDVKFDLRRKARLVAGGN